MTDPRLSFLASVAPAEEAGLRRRLGTRLVVAAGAATCASFAGQVLLFQLATLLGRLFDHVVLEFDAPADLSVHQELRPVLPPGDLKQALDAAVYAVRDREAVPPEPENGYFRVVVGPQPRSEAPVNLYVGASGWRVALSVTTPAQLVETRNPAGPLAAGALAAAEVFKLVFRDLLQAAVPLTASGPDQYTLSLLDYQAVPAAVAAEPELPASIPVDLTLFGCGSVGCAVALGLLLTRQLAGQLTVVDNGAFDERNPAKYTLLDHATAKSGAWKAVWGQRLFAAGGPAGLEALAFVGTATQFVAAQPQSYVLPLVISAVDTRDARVEIQDTLPRRVVNAGVDGTMTEVSVHGFGEGPCLACLSVGQQRESWAAKGVAEKIGLPVQRTYELIRGNLPMTADDVGAIRAAGVAPAELLADVESFVGQPVLSFYNRVLYSETTLTTASGTRARITTAFVSAFAGALILAEALKELVPDLHPYRADNSYRQNVLGVPADDRMRHARDETGWCLCHSHFRQQVYRQKYPVGG